MLAAIIERYEMTHYGKEVFSYRREIKEICEKLNILPFPVATKIQIEKVVQECDFLFVTGGHDINPKYYGREREEKTELDFYETDTLDFAMIQAFHQVGKPILGICKGMQSINVYFGGTLHQDIPNHMLLEESNSLHPATILEIPSFVHDYYNKQKIMVNSLHHQAVDQVAPGFEVTALSEDGIIEGIQKENIIGVQWHPEVLLDIGFFETFIQTYVNNKEEPF